MTQISDYEDQASEGSTEDPEIIKKSFLTDSEIQECYNEVAGIWVDFKAQSPGSAEAMNKLITSLL